MKWTIDCFDDGRHFIRAAGPQDGSKPPIVYLPPETVPVVSEILHDRYLFARRARLLARKLDEIGRYDLILKADAELSRGEG